MKHMCVWLLRRCPGTREAMAAFSGRRTLTAYVLYDGLMRGVGGGGEPDQAVDMRLEGAEGVTPATLLGAREPSEPEERLWFQERSRCRSLLAPLLARWCCACLFAQPGCCSCGHAGPGASQVTLLAEKVALTTCSKGQGRSGPHCWLPCPPLVSCILLCSLHMIV